MLQTPQTLARPIRAAVAEEPPPYNWQTQGRSTDYDIYAMSHTGNSIQTFDSNGKPSDARSDNTD